ncbi:MAG: hypothetical protein P3W93_007005 [Thermus sp.]|nr:hypothetical protein [Thermus sp.]
MQKRWFGLLALLALAFAHAPVPERPEVYTPEARLFALDNRKETSRLVALDLPQGQVVGEISLPPKSMSLVAAPSGQYLLVPRGRDTDRQWLSVVWTGKEEGRWSRPVLAKSLLLGRGWNVGHGAKPYTLGRRLVAFAERDAVAFLFPEESLTPEAAFQAERVRLPSPDHYHIVEAPEGTYITFLRRGQVVLYDAAWGERARFSCPAQHGEALHRETGRSVYACATEVLVLEGGKELSRLPYPVPERIGAFLEGEGVFFGYSDSVEHLQRLDPKALALSPIPLEGVFVRGKSDGKRLYVLLKDGTLQVREAREGRLLRKVRVVPKPFPEVDEDTGGAIYPDIAPWPERGLAYVSLPHLGLVAEVDVERGRMVRYLRVGGSPTRLVLVRP